MKKIFRSFFAIAATVAALASCVKDFDQTVASGNEKVINFIASQPQTRAAFTLPTGDSYPVLWSAQDTAIKLTVNYSNSLITAKGTPAADGKTNRFSATISSGAATSNIIAISPAKAFVGVSGNIKLSIDFPASQTPLDNSVDENAMVLVAKTGELSVIPDSIQLQFNHLAAYCKFSLANLNLGDKEIQGISFTSNKEWAGRWYYFPETDSLATYSATKNISIITNKTSDIWFSCVPVDLSGESIDLVVATDNGTFTKTITFPADRKLQAGKIHRFSVDMSDATFTAPAVFKLVTSASDLKAGDKVIIAAKDYNFAMSTLQQNSNRSQAAVSKADSSIVSPAADVEIFTLRTGTKTNTFGFQCKSSNKYIFAASSSSNHLKSQDALDDNASFSIVISSTGTSITA